MGDEGEGEGEENRPIDEHRDKRLRPRDPEGRERREVSAWKHQETQLRILNEALDLQSRRLDELAKLHQSQAQELVNALGELQETIKLSREATAQADTARSELVTATAALVKIALVMQETLDELAEEQQQ